MQKFIPENDWAIVLFGSEDGKLVTGPVLDREGSLWLVPQWLSSPDGKRQKPAHAIRLPWELIQLTPKEQDYQFPLSGSVPKQCLERAESAEPLGIRFEVRVAPEWILHLQPIH